MRGSIWTVVALGAMAVMTPLVLDVDVSGDETGQTALELVSALDILVGLAFAVAVFGLLIAFFTDSGF